MTPHSTALSKLLRASPKNLPTRLEKVSCEPNRQLLRNHSVVCVFVTHDVDETDFGEMLTVQFGDKILLRSFQGNEDAGAGGGVQQG